MAVTHPRRGGSLRWSAPARRSRRLALVLAVGLAVLSCTVEPEAEREEIDEALDSEGDVFVATDGDDANPGTAERPLLTLEHALDEIEAGEHVVVRGGVYRERLTDVRLPDATAQAPTLIRAAKNEQVVIKGLLWLHDGSHWAIEGIDVTWDESSGSPDEHMVKVTNGRDWAIRGGEFSDAQSYAALLVTGSRDGEPAGWEVSGNCIRHTVPTNGVNQDHNLYVNTGLSAGEGLVEGNVLFGAPNGDNLKLGPPGREGGTANVVVRNNTLFDAVQNLLVSGESRDNLIERNILGATLNDNASIRSFGLTGSENLARDNVAFDAAAVVDEPNEDDDGLGVEDAGGNRAIDPGFDDTEGCDGFKPSNPEVNGYGHTGSDAAHDGG
jgi:hypothetical protein